ncbi:MAG: hypothetical protein AAGF93_21120 [Cyanobacteria bacterium P01_H01_bin.105]
MNKFILGGILAAISLMAIYGTSASNRVTSWVDRSNDNTSAQTDFGAANEGTNETFIALNDDGTTNDSNGIISSQTPLERAGEIPQRQTVGAQSAPNFGTSTQPTNTGDDTDGGVVNPNPTAGDTNAQETPPANNPGQTQSGQNQNLPPVRALW